MIKYLIFDFDGTIADTTEGILRTTEETLKRMGLPVCPDEQVKRCIGLPLKGHLAAALIPEGRLDEAVDLYHELFYEVAPKHISIFDGVKEALEECNRKGLQMGIATSRGENSLKLLLKEHGIDRYFTVLGTVNCVERPKPNPDLVLWVLDRFNEVNGTAASPEETLVIGDTTFDLQMGSSAGCRTCAVTYGNHTRQMLETASPDFIVDNLRDLPALI